MTVACNKSEKETPNGFKFKVVKAGDGVLPKPGEIVVFDHFLKDSKDSVWVDSRKQEMPAVLMIADSAALSTEMGIIQMLRMLSMGDSINFQMPVTKFFKEIAKSPLPHGVDSLLTLSYSISIKEITDREKYTAKQQELMQKKQAKQLATDIAIIDKFLMEKGIKAEKAESGLRFVITQTGKGNNVASGQSVKVNYAGYTLDGKYFDSSVKSLAQEKGIYNPQREPYSPYDVIIDQSQVIRGWHEALKLMNKGSKATFYIPSTLGYGPQRRSDIIIENSILVFDLEILDIK